MPCKIYVEGQGLKYTDKALQLELKILIDNIWHWPKSTIIIHWQIVY